MVEDLKLVSDGWRHIAELNATNNALVRSYVWGLDLSGSLDGAGGVGGLLWVGVGPAVPSGPQAHFCAYDGNGNVAALVSASDGSETARYDYGPFGEPLRVTGPAAANPFRFSTKRTDNTTDLVLYEYRLYNPTTGRWPNRDPIGEFGGTNLYGMAGNDPANWLDVLGLCKKGDCQVKYLGSENRRLAYFSVQNLADADLGTPPQEILDLILDTTLEELFKQLTPDIFRQIANRIVLVLAADKNAFLHWDLRYKAKANYEIRKCECKKRNPWTLWMCCVEWGWSKPSKGTIDLKDSFEGSHFMLDLTNISSAVETLIREFLEAVDHGKSQFVTTDGWGSVFEKAIEEKKHRLACKDIKFVTEVK